MQRYVYFMISQTPTRFGYIIRKVGKTKYNHAAVALDPELTQLYAFARTQHKSPLTGGLVRETLSRYTLWRYENIPVVIFRVAVTESQYDWVCSTIENMIKDGKYMYNLFSTITYPLTGGFPTYKAFSCIEFAIYILQHLNYEITKPCFRYEPDDLMDLLGGCVCFSGNLLEYRPNDGDGGDYFAPFSLGMLKNGILSIAELTKRLFHECEDRS